RVCLCCCSEVGKAAARRDENPRRQSDGGSRDYWPADPKNIPPPALHAGPVLVERSVRFEVPFCRRRQEGFAREEGYKGPVHTQSCCCWCVFCCRHRHFYVSSVVGLHCKFCCVWARTNRTACLMMVKDSFFLLLCLIPCSFCGGLLAYRQSAFLVSVFPEIFGAVTVNC
ncbi:unnamed protein product, partial [Ectocarpus sp. 6 AP-2014]